MSKKALSKSELTERISLRALRYATTFDQGNLDEWIKQGLAFASERDQNIGRKPIYIYGCRHYRRALQLVRLKSRGIKDRDELLLQLFIRDYGVKPHEIREALEKEYCKAREQLNSALRSTFADKHGPIPSGRKSQLLRQIGPLDERLNNAGFIVPDDLLISAVRSARTSDNTELNNSAINVLAGDVQDLFNSLKPLFAGMLAKDDENASEIEHLIRSSNENAYELAKTGFRQIRVMFWPGPITAGSNSAERIGYRAIHDAICSREFAAFLLVQCLRHCVPSAESRKSS